MISASTSPSSTASGRVAPEAWCEQSCLVELIRENMPITQHLQFSLFQDAADDLVATAPLAPNANHQKTAFGGSLSMLATVAGWAMTHLLLRTQCDDAAVVIQKSRIDYNAPVCGDLLLRCPRPSAQEQASFFETLERWGKARLSLCCTMMEDGEQLVCFKGAYVALAS